LAYVLATILAIMLVALTFVVWNHIAKPRGLDADALGGALKLIDNYLSQKRYMEALVISRKIVKEEPDNPRTRIALAHVYVAQQKPERAKDELAVILEHYPNNVEARHILDELENKR
jgi:Tfp pilus assembly protein PilF